jgi:hypothetical protein
LYLQGGDKVLANWHDGLYVFQKENCIVCKWNKIMGLLGHSFKLFLSPPIKVFSEH